MLGLGYIGLPTAGMLAVAGHRVAGVDVNPSVVESLRNGRVHLNEPDLATLATAALQSGNLSVHPEVAPADVFLIAVPTPLADGQRADVSHVRAAGRAVAQHLAPGNLVILESTVPPGTTRDTLAPLLESSGLTAGQDFHVAYCPERVLPGAIVQELVHNERTVGGLTPRCAVQAAQVYRSFVKGEIHLTDCATAEMVKLMENTFRDVNIALANELALVSEAIGVDVWEAIRLANRHPRVNVLRPGPGVGGHCIAVDPWFLAEALPEKTPLIQASRAINDAMPEHVVDLLETEVKPGDGPVALLGAAYKGNTDDSRESPAWEVVRLALARGYEVRLYDPFVKSLPPFDDVLLPLPEALQAARALVLLTDHDEFRRLIPEEVGQRMSRRVLIDTRNWLDRDLWAQHGFKVTTLGSGTPTDDGWALLSEVGPTESARRPVL